MSFHTQSLLVDPITTAASEVSKQRFTIDGSPELEAVLLQLCEKARESVLRAFPSHRVDGMMLGGGYGRGEGGVLRASRGDQPYNDLEFYVFLRGLNPLTASKYQHILHQCGEELTAEARIDVELRAFSFPKLRRSPTSMFYYDLVMGHRWIIGDENLLQDCDHHRRAELIPLAEAARLLMNRCSGLLFSKERLQHPFFSRQDADFVARNIAKAKLALGDVVLAAFGQYHWSCRERNHRLQNAATDLPWDATLRSLHSEGVEFKLHPSQSDLSAEQLRTEHQAVSKLARELWLWLESRRLGQNFQDIPQYAFNSSNKCPETKSLRNLLINFRTDRHHFREPFHYPRERLLRSLPLLLWSWNDPPQEKLLRFLQRQLSTKPISFTQFVDSYRSLWAQFN